MSWKSALKGLVKLTAVLVVLMSIAAFFLARSPGFGASAQGPRLQRMQQSARFADGQFHNSVATPMGMNGEASATIFDYLSGGQERVPKTPPPVHQPQPSSLVPSSQDGLRIHWMGHSSMLIEIDGHLILTDPVWGPRCSPFSWMGPARFHPPPLPVEDLPPLDAVLISHDHYDHLDLPTITALKDRVPLFLTPLGVGAHLESWGVAPERIVEMDWWEEKNIGNLRLVATPARHFSGRVPGQVNPTLWASWALIGPQHRVWFSGDTGPYEQGFTEIGERLGPFDAAMIEIGAYHPSWGNIHLGPDAATLVHKQVRAAVMVPIHWGTFNLAIHAWDEPIIDLQRLAAERDITLGVPIVGQAVDPQFPSVDPFWQERAAAK